MLFQCRQFFLLVIVRVFALYVLMGPIAYRLHQPRRQHPQSGGKHEGASGESNGSAAKAERQGSLLLDAALLQVRIA
jgi:hypothetical protein